MSVSEVAVFVRIHVIDYYGRYDFLFNCHINSSLKALFYDQSLQSILKT